MRRAATLSFLSLSVTWILILFGIAGGDLYSQIATPDQDAVTMPRVEKVRARFEYFWNRVSYPGGQVPSGARTQAFWQSQKLPAFAPSVRHAGMDLTWVNKGPDNIGGRILAIAVNPKNPRTIFIGAANGGVWRTFDEGASWHSVSDDFPTQAMGAIVINPVDTNIVYAGTGEASFGQHTFDGAGLMKSTDGGTTWFQIGQSTLPDFARFSDFAINPIDPNILYAALPDGMRSDTLAGIWRSKDGGLTWALVLTGVMTDIVINPIDPSILYTVSSVVFGGGSAARFGMYKTTDGGESWFPVDMGLPSTQMGRTSLAICATQPDILLAGVSEITGNERTWLKALVKSTNGGTTWTPLTVPFDYMVSQGWYDNIVGIHPTNPSILYAGGVKLIRSGDGGTTWERIPDQGFGGILHVDQHAIEFNPLDPDRVYIGNDGGFYIGTQEGKNWIKSDLGLSITQFIGGAMHPTDERFLFGGTQDNGSMLSTGAPRFDPVLYGDGGNGAVNPAKPNVLYTTQENLSLHRSDDFGRTWIRALGDIAVQSSLFYISYAMDEKNPETLHLGTYRMFKTTNEGRNWTLAKDCLFPTGTSCYYISAVSVAPYNSNLVMAGATGGMVALSQDAGTTWNVLPTTDLPAAYCSAVRSFRANEIYATYSRYGVSKVWHSTDLGVTWTDRNGDLPDIPVNDILVLDNTILLGTDLGCFASTDQGTHWTRFGSGMPALSVQKLIWHSETGIIRAITHGRGMYDLVWNAPSAKAPVFLSQAPASTLEPGQPFTYVPVVSARPAPRFRLLEGPSDATCDPVHGIVRWNGNTASARFRLEASNSEGTAEQTFTLGTHAAPTGAWKVTTQHFPEEVQCLSNVGRSSLWVGQDSAKVSISQDRGLTWSHVSIPGTRAAVFTIVPFDARFAYAGTRDGRVVKTEDGGLTWTTLLYRTNSGFGNLHFWSRTEGIAVTVGDKDSADVFLTQDGGATWTRQFPRPFARAPINRTMTFLDRDNGWFASSNIGRSPAGDAFVLRTTNGGRNWTAYSSITPAVGGVGFLSKTAGFLVDNVTGGTRRTTNGGVAWRTTTYPMNRSRCAGIWADSASRITAVATDSAVWFSRDLGTTWTRTALVLSGFVQDMAFADSTLGWVITKNGVLQELLANPLVGIAAGPDALPRENTLGQAWPNPSTIRDASILIPFRLSRPSPTLLRVFNSGGKQVAVIVDRDMPAGDHTAVFDASALPAGMYFYTLDLPGFRMTGRMAVMR